MCREGKRLEQVVVVVECEERRFFPVPRTSSVEEVVIAALESRFAAAGWWAIPTALRIEDPDLVWIIRQSEQLDDCEILEVGAMISVRWARRAFERIVEGEDSVEQERVMLVA